MWCSVSGCLSQLSVIPRPAPPRSRTVAGWYRGTEILKGLVVVEESARSASWGREELQRAVAEQDGWIRRLPSYVGPVNAVARRRVSDRS